MNDIIPSSENSGSITLEDRARRVRLALSASIDNLLVAGRELVLAKNELEHGQWEQWVREMVGIDPSTARRYIRVAESMASYFYDNDNLSGFVSRRAMYALSSGDVDDGVRDKAVDLMEKGTFVTAKIASALIKAADNLEKLGRYAPHITDRVASLVSEYDMEPEMVPVLSRIERQHEDLFREIELSGSVYAASGEAIPLDEARARDVQAYLDKANYESRVESSKGEGVNALILSKIEADHIVLTRVVQYPGGVNVVIQDDYTVKVGEAIVP